MALEQKFFDDFNNATVDVKTDPGNGAITEPAGSSLIASITAGQHAGWGGGTGNDNEGAPIAYEDLADHVDEASGLLRFETRLTNLTKTGNEVFSGLTVWQDRNNAYTIGWYDYNDNVYIYKIVGDVGRTNIWQAGNYGHPNTTPHIYRFYVNLTDDKIALPEGGTLNAKSIGFKFSSNDGSSWVYPHQRALDFAPRRFGIYALNWASTWRGCDVSFDYLKLEQDLEPLVVIAESPDSPSTTGLLEDHLALPDPGEQPAAPKGLLEERISFPVVGGDLAHTALQQSTGLPQPTKGYLEEKLRVALADADYVPWKQDGDGNNLLQDSDVIGVVLADPTLDSFGSPVTQNHWGAAQDGKFYADGVECTPGVFGTLAGGWNHVGWRNSEEEPFQLGKANGSASIVADDTVRLQMTSASGWPGGPGLMSNLKWTLLAGDFDIQLDFANGSWDHNDHALQFGITYNQGGPEGTNHVYVGRTRSRYEFMRISNGVWAAVATGGGADASGKFRLTRVSGVYHAYYWTGSWVELGTGYTHPLGDQPVLVWMDVNGTSSVTLSFDISNFTIVSGTTSNRAGWYREASGSHRGTQQDMPDALGVATSKNSVELIDTANDKLWMRFVQGTNNVLGATTANVRARHVVWDNGTLFVAYASKDGAGGAAIKIDFTMDRVRWHRIDTAGDTGGFYRGTGVRATGGIAVRNSATGGYTGDHDDWRIPDYRVWHVDLIRILTKEYRVSATEAGLAVHRWTRWYTQGLTDYSLSNEVTAMKWCFFDRLDGELFYADTTKVYSVARSGAGGWETVMTGGTFTAQTEKSLPGTRHVDSQYLLVRYGDYLFIPAWEGVYRVNWPSGSWELFYGSAGSGATHEILPDYQQVLSLALGKDGVVDLLAIGLRFRGLGGGQIVVAKLSDNTVYGLGRVRQLEDPRYMGAA